MAQASPAKQATPPREQGDVLPEVCNCASVELPDVAYRTRGISLVPYHKSCGGVLPPSRVREYEEKVMRRWNTVP